MGVRAMGVRARWESERWGSERDGVPSAMGGERRFTMAKGALMEGVTAETCSITRKQSLRLARGVG